MNPNFECCQGCPYWDDVNGCWRDTQPTAECPFVDEDGMFNGDQYDKFTA